MLVSCTEDASTVAVKASRRESAANPAESFIVKK
jgi:hypothetical protein